MKQIVSILIFLFAIVTSPNLYSETDDEIEESDETNNAGKIVIRLNKNPILDSVQNITVNETDRIKINLSASDPNGDALSYSINYSKFSSNLNIFEWNTTTADSGNYTLKAAASDGYLDDIKFFNIVILDNPELDSDNDGINDSIDKLIGNQNSINTSTVNVSIFVNNSNDLNKILNDAATVKIYDNSLTIAEFEFDFSRYRLNLTNVTINKQGTNKTGSIIFSGLSLPSGMTKTLYLDKINQTSGICIKDEEVLSLSQVSNSCDSANEYKIECDGTLQNGYTCAYNLTLNKYRITGLKHSGIQQMDYSKPAAQPSSGSGSNGGDSGNSGGGGGGGSGTACIPDWKCEEWSGCINGVRSRKCFDANKCDTPAKKPEEDEKCLPEGKNIKNNESEKLNLKEQIKNGKNNLSVNGITGFAINEKIPGLSGWVIDSIAILIAAAISIYSIRRLFSKNL